MSRTLILNRRDRTRLKESDLVKVKKGQQAAVKPRQQTLIDLRPHVGVAEIIIQWIGKRNFHHPVERMVPQGTVLRSPQRYHLLLGSQSEGGNQGVRVDIKLLQGLLTQGFQWVDARHFSQYLGGAEDAVEFVITRERRPGSLPIDDRSDTEPDRKPLAVMMESLTKGMAGVCEIYQFQGQGTPSQTVHITLTDVWVSKPHHIIRFSKNSLVLQEFIG